MFSLYKIFINALFHYFSLYNLIRDIILSRVNIEVREFYFLKLLFLKF